MAGQRFGRFLNNKERASDIKELRRSTGKKVMEEVAFDLGLERCVRIRIFWEQIV